MEIWPKHKSTEQNATEGFSIDWLNTGYIFAFSQQNILGAKDLYYFYFYFLHCIIEQTEHTQ